MNKQKLIEYLKEEIKALNKSQRKMLAGTEPMSETLFEALSYQRDAYDDILQKVYDKVFE